MELLGTETWTLELSGRVSRTSARGGGADEQPRADVVCGSEELARWVVWTHLGKDFVCLEPWTAAANALDTGERLLVIEPGGERVLSVSISLEW